MKNRTTPLILLILFFICEFVLSQPDGQNGIRLELIVRQKPVMVDKYFEITRDTVDIVIGTSLYTFLVNMSLEIEVDEVDSLFATFNMHLATVGSNPYNFARRYRIQFNLPARIENIPGKNGSVYQLLISPRNLIHIDTTLCSHDLNDKDQFNMDPSAHFDLYYAKQSLADFHWNNIKNYLEADLTRFRNALDITAPGKINFYLCPCPVASINWDKRFGYAIDPTRSNIYSIYNHDFVSVDAILPNMLMLLRLWGYAPPFLVEGLAGYFDFTAYKIKELKSQGKIPRIKELITTSGYHAAEAVAAEITAASFMKYLADSYGINKAINLYEQSDDLTLLRNFESLYDTPIDSLEQEWLHYIDTVLLTRRLFDHYAARANALFQSDLQIEYLEEMTKYDETRIDSIDTWKKLSMVYYQYGYYYKALEGYKRLIAIDSSLPLYWQVLGNLYMINGEYDAAREALDTVLFLDSVYATAKLLQAKILAIKGDTASAVKIANDFYSVEETAAGKIEFLLFLGTLYGAKGMYYDSAKAEQYFSDALVWSNDMIPKTPDDPTFKMRAGLAHLGLGQYEEARQYLELAYFIELRAYYQGRILLNLGKLYDAQGGHNKAVEYYQEALSIPLAEFHRQLCTQYISKPYRN